MGKEVKYPYAHIEYRPFKGVNWEKVEWSTWDLKKSVTSLHTLTFTLSNPEKHVDINSDTGFKYNIGGEIRLIGDRGLFGGYINSVNGNLERGDISISAYDWRYLFKRKVIINDYDKINPLNFTSNRINMFLPVSNLHDLVVEFMGLVDPVVSTTNMGGNPFLFVNRGNALTRVMGAGTTSSSVGYLGNPSPCISVDSASSSDTEVIFDIYDNPIGVDVNDYPLFVFDYHWGKGSGSLWGFRFLINGNWFYVPWTSSLSLYTGTFLDGIPPKRNTHFSNVVYPLAESLDQKYPSNTYTLTKIQLLQRVAGPATIPVGAVLFDNIGMLSKNWVVINPSKHSKTDMLTSIMDACEYTGAYFWIDSDRNARLTWFNEGVVNETIVEGVNLLDADTVVNDESLYNKLWVFSGVTEDKGVLVGEVNEFGVGKFGVYEDLREESGYDRKGLQIFIDRLISNKGRVQPRITCNIKSNFNINEGEIIYFSSPSLGIERNVMVYEINHDHTGKCSLVLGKPNFGLEQLLTEVLKKEEETSNRANQGVDDGNRALRETTFTPVGGTGTKSYVGEQLIGDIKSLWEKDKNNYLWIHQQLADKIVVNKDNIQIHSPIITGHEIVIPVVFDLKHEKFRDIATGRLRYTNNGMTGTGNIKLIDPLNKKVNLPHDGKQLITPSANVMMTIPFTLGSGSQEVSWTATRLIQNLDKIIVVINILFDINQPSGRSLNLNGCEIIFNTT